MGHSGYPKTKYPWARPIMTILAEDLTGETERRKERARVAAHHAAAAAALTDTEKRFRELRDEAAKLDQQTLRLLRSNTLGQLSALSKVIPGLVKTLTRLNEQLERGTDAGGKALDLTPFQIASLAHKIAGALSLLARGADLISTVEGRTLANPVPVETTGEGGPALTDEEMLEEVERTRAAIEATRETEEDDPEDGVIPGAGDEEEKPDPEEAVDPEDDDETPVH